MTVQQLIDALMAIDDKTLPVYTAVEGVLAPRNVVTVREPTNEQYFPFVELGFSRQVALRGIDREELKKI